MEIISIATNTIFSLSQNEDIEKNMNHLSNIALHAMTPYQNWTIP
jgi:hypothetical protein